MIKYIPFEIFIWHIFCVINNNKKLIGLIEMARLAYIQVVSKKNILEGDNIGYFKQKYSYVLFRMISVIEYAKLLLVKY